MKALLLPAVLASAFFITPAAAQLGPYCGYNEPFRITSYYQYPGGPECGVTQEFCEGDTYYHHSGCSTSYYSVWYNSCLCQ